jgi:hypothetical protein
MGRRPATIRDANAAKACADAVAGRLKLFQSAAAFAILLLLVCAPMLRAQTLGTISGVTNAVAINSNNSAGQAYNAVLHSNSSVTLLQDGAILSTVVCPAYTVSGAGITVSTGAIIVDSANNRIYLAMLSGVTLYAAYESIDQTAGTCTPGPLLQLTTNAQSNLEMNVDPKQGNVYVLNSFGAFPDTLYILPTAPWSASPLPTPTTLTMDYSAQYGPIVIDPSNDLVYVNDLGGSAYGTVGTYSTSGFFVYDPNYSATPANNLQHVVGYCSSPPCSSASTSSGTTPTPFYVGTLLSNGAGELVLVNENPSASSTNLSVPITILNTTAPQSLFFGSIATPITHPYNYNNDVDITPGTALSTISATAPYEAISGADIDAANQVVYAYAFNTPNSAQPGMLLEYSLSSTANPQETVLGAMAKPNLYSSLAPWSELNYDPESTELVLSVSSEYVSGALGLTSQLCAGTPPTLTQLFGSAVAPTPLGYPVVNSVSGYTYAIQPASSYPAVPPVVNFVAPPTGGCSASPPIQISPATITYGFAGESYFENFTANGGSGAGYVWRVTSGTALSAVGLSLTSAGEISGSPNAAETAAPFTVEVVDSQGNSATQNYTLTIYPDFSITPTTLPAGAVGTPYSQMFNASGGAGGPFSFSVISGTALSAVGLSLSPGGLISGTPSTTETAAPLTIKVADSLGDFTQLNYTLTINSASSGPITINDPETVTVNDSATQVQLVDVSDPETITATDIAVVTVSGGLTITGPASLLPGVVGVPYPTTTITASGGSQPYSWAISGLPPGLTANGGGVITGTPTTDAGSPYSVMVVVTDATLVAITKSYSLTVSGSLTIASPALLTPATLNVAYTPTTITASGGLSPYKWTATGLPAGLSINANSGTISGTPTADAGSPYSVTVTVEDSTGKTANMTYSLTVGAALTITGPASLPSADLNVGYSETFGASGGSLPYTWTASGQPSGLTMSAGGVLSGTPTVAGVFAVTVKVQDSTGNTNSVIFSLTVVSPSLGISASPSSLTIVQGQSGQTTITFTPVGGYSGPVTLGCSSLPANTLCVFTLNGTSINSYTFPGNNQQVVVTLTIETDVSALARTESTQTPLRPGAIFTAIAFWCPGSLLGVIALRRKRKMFTENPRVFGLCLFVALVGAMAGLAGCISGGGFGTYVTPAGTSTVTVVVTPGSGSAQTLNIGVTITQ